MSERPLPPSDAYIRVPRHPNLAFFAMLVRKGELMNQQYQWSGVEVAAGRMTPEQRLDHLNQLWATILVPTELPPLPEKFC